MALFTFEVGEENPQRVVLSSGHDTSNRAPFSLRQHRLSSLLHTHSRIGNVDKKSHTQKLFGPGVLSNSVPRLWNTLPRTRGVLRTQGNSKEKMRCCRQILRISYKDHVTNEEVRAQIQQTIGSHEDLLTNVKRW